MLLLQKLLACDWTEPNVLLSSTLLSGAWWLTVMYIVLLYVCCLVKTNYQVRKLFIYLSVLFCFTCRRTNSETYYQILRFLRAVHRREEGSPSFSFCEGMSFLLAPRFSTIVCFFAFARDGCFGWI